MEQTINRIALAVIIIGIFGIAMAIMTQRSLGSVNDASAAYQSTTTRTGGQTGGGGVALTSPSTLANGFGTLGSVVITGAGTGVITLYDGTTTAAHSDSGTTTLASFPASTAAGTYQFDSVFYKGLIYEVTGTTGTTTITWKK